MGFPINCLTLSWSAPVSLGLGGPTNPSLVGGSTKSCVKLEIFPPIVVLLVFPTIVLLTIKLGVYNNQACDTYLHAKIAPLLSKNSSAWLFLSIPNALAFSKSSSVSFESK